jgi:lipoprotein-anchoring transpeptidase ErfK/SrfK
VASGENRAFSDPLAAGSLCWAYDAPLLLVHSSGVPAEVRAALAEIRAVNTTVTVTVVGGSIAVPPAVTGELKRIVGPAGTVEQPWLGGDRFSLAAGIAMRVRDVAAETSRTVPARALVANGTNQAGFVDALAISAVSARTGVPVLLVERDRVPEATRVALAGLPAGDVIVAGGTGVVSQRVYDALGAVERWAGADRYATALSVARNARLRGWLDGGRVGVAATVPDSLAGATYVGRDGGPLLYVSGASIGIGPATFIQDFESVIASATVFGGTAVVPESVSAELAGAPSMPMVSSPPVGGYVAKKASVVAVTGINTTELALYAGDTLIAKRAVGSYPTVDFGLMPMPSAGAAYRLVATNPEEGRTTWARTYRRLTYPAATSIVIDKSEFRLYLVKGDVLVASYPVAIGRPSMETPVRLWKVGMKYYTDPKGVYGPRKLRLFMRSGSGFVYTRYGIHGTNEPWVIGTKASHGCIRLYNADILKLFPQVPVGTLVQTRE